MTFADLKEAGSGESLLYRNLVNADNRLRVSTEAEVKAAGKYMQKGRTYEMQDGGESLPCMSSD